MNYEHTQTGNVFILMTTMGIIICGVLAILKFEGMLVVAMVAIVLSMLLFHSIRITVDESCLRVRYGIGVIGLKIKLEDIASYQVVRNPWYYGWGIHRIPGGWLYNISGFEALEIVLRKGKKFRIGTDEPLELKNHLDMYFIDHDSRT